MIDVEEYWDTRYKKGGTSGAGSRGKAADYKAKMVNHFIQYYDIFDMIDMGCGDGYIAGKVEVADYIGVDVSNFALQICRARFPDREFYHYSQALPTTDMVLSMDVLLHLVNDTEFENYMERVFALADKLVVLYTTNYEDKGNSAAHVKHRHVTRWIKENIDGWHMIEFHKSPIPDGISAADFYVYERDING